MLARAAYADEAGTSFGDLLEAEEDESLSSGADKSEKELWGTGGRGGEACLSGR